MGLYLKVVEPTEEEDQKELKKEGIILIFLALFHYYLSFIFSPTCCH